ncbi:MAG: hypothetical protein ACREQN_19275 [Candidatus Binataceae bacterium]
MTTRERGLRVAQNGDTYSLPDSSYSVESAAVSVAVPARPRAQDLLPCPLSVPCRVVPNDDDALPAVSVPPRAAFEETSVPRAATRLLPCPKSVPCIATPGYSATVQPRPSVQPHPAAHVSRPVAPMRASAAPRATQKHRNGVTTNRRIRTAIVKRAINADDTIPDIKRITPVDLEREVTLEGTPALKHRAEQSLRESDKKLAQIAPERLEGDAAVTYGQAGSLLNAGHNALNDRDYLTAFGLGSKVSQLIATLPPASHTESSPRRTR